MSLQNAINFISKVDSDSDFRKSCYAYKSQTDLLNSLIDMQMGFTPNEIEDAFNVLELKCQTYEQAGRVKEVKAWFRLFG
ncbi:MAG TPA: hypothetical protein P5084_13730 [Paludibacter sp.]|nr:hypothetical protein [Paludibacter sp.]